MIETLIYFFLAGPPGLEPRTVVLETTILPIKLQTCVLCFLYSIKLCFYIETT